MGICISTENAIENYVESIHLLEFFIRYLKKYKFSMKKNPSKYGSEVDRLDYTLKAVLSLYVQLTFDTSSYTGDFL